MNAREFPLPPHSVESEQSILGALMLDQNAFERIVGKVTASDFYTAGHRVIFAAIQYLNAQGEPVDVITVAEALHDAGEDERCGGLAYLGELASNTPSASNILHYAEVVREKAVLRGLLSVVCRVQEACLAKGVKDPGKIALEAEGEMLALIDRQGGEPSTLAEVFSETIAFIDERCQQGGELSGLATGFDDFDRLTGGLEPGQLVIVAARPSVGKSIFGVNVADRVAQGGRSALFFTLEMSKREIGMRLSKNAIPRCVAATTAHRGSGHTRGFDG